MASSQKSSTSNKQTREQKQDRVITFNQSVSLDTFNALSRVKKSKGMLTEQEVVRLAIALFLEKNG